MLQRARYAAAMVRLMPITRPANAMHILKYAAGLENYVREHQIDVIYAHELWPAGAIANAVSQRTGAASVVAGYGECFGLETQHKRWRRANRSASANADFLLSTSEHCMKQARGISGRSADKSRVIYAGVDIDRFNPSVAGDSWRQRQDIEPDAFVVSVLGLVLRRKLDVFVEALRLMDPDTKLVAIIGGKGQDEQHFKNIVRDIDNVDLLFAGFVSEDELPEFYAASDVLVVSPRTELECMGQSMKEAMACATATVGARIGGIPEAIEDGINGLLYAPDDPADLARALNQMKTDPTSRARMGQAGRKTAESKFDAVDSARVTLEVFDQAIEISRSRHS